MTAAPGASAAPWRSPSPDCRPTGSSSRASCRQGRPAPDPHCRTGDIPATLILYESGPRIGRTLAALAEGSAPGQPRCAANSPSCTRRSGAATSRRWRRITKAAPKFAASSPSSSRRQGRRRPARCRRGGRAAAARLATRLGEGRGRATSPPPPAGRGARSISARSRSVKATMAAAVARTPRDHAAPGTRRGASRRPLGGKPRCRLSGRQGLSHRGAALRKPGRRNRHRRAPPRRAGVRRGEGAQHARWRRRIRPERGSSAGSRPRLRLARRASRRRRERHAVRRGSGRAGRIPRHIPAAFETE